MKNVAATLILTLGVATGCTGDKKIDSTFTVGGDVSGLTDTLVIANNGADELTLSEDGAFTFATGLKANNTYTVTIVTQPAGQTCTVVNGSGTIASGNVTDVSISCEATAANTFTVGGTASGLPSSNGTVILTNGTDQVSVTANGAFTFPTSQATGASYNVVVVTNPTGYTCSVGSGSGTIASANVTNVTVTCAARTYIVSGTIVNAFASFTLGNGSATLPIASGQTAFAFTGVAASTGYNVQVTAQPAGGSCTVSNGAGTVSNANITNILVNCAITTYAVSGTLSGATGAVVLSDGTSEQTILTGTTEFSFGGHAPNTTYSVSVVTAPYGQECEVSGPALGTMGTSDVTDITVSCTDLPIFTLSGSITGATGALTLENAGDPNQYVIESGTTTFSIPVFGGAAYNVTVTVPPPQQTCAVTGGSGTNGFVNVTGVVVVCGSLTVSGTISGNTGNLVLATAQNGNLALINVADNANSFQLNGFGPGDTYSVDVHAPARGTNCTVSGSGASSPAGTLANESVAGIAIDCTPASYTFAIATVGLSGEGESGSASDPLNVVWKYNSEPDIVSNISAATFYGPVPHGTAITLTVVQNPASKTCVFEPSATFTVDNAYSVGTRLVCTANSGL